MSFVTSMSAVLDNRNNVSITENGAVGFRTTGRSLLDLNFSVPSLRNSPESEIIEKWEQAYRETPELAMRWLFFLRDPRSGIGERRSFRVILKWMAENHPELIRNLIGVDNQFTPFIGEIIPYYGRWDDLLTLTDTDMARKIYRVIDKQLKADLAAMENGCTVSLLAKWLPSLSNKNTKAAARKLAKKIGWLETPYRQAVSKLRHHLDVTEVKMSHRQWDEIQYSGVPSRAAMLYGKAFQRHDPERYTAFIQAVNNGEAKINAGTLFPHEIVCKMMDVLYTSDEEGGKERSQLEALWKNLPCTIPPGSGGTIVVRDGSGSMGVRIGSGKASAENVADAMSIYFSQYLCGEFHNKVLSFSETPRLIDLDKACDGSLAERLKHLHQYDEVANTNVEAVFDLILETAVKAKMPQDWLPGTILIISDMEFDTCAVTNQDVVGGGYSHHNPGNMHRLFDVIASRFEAAGYKLPKVVFWNVNSRTNTIPMKDNEFGVALVSGFSQNLAKMVMSSKTDPWEVLVEQLWDRKYDPISLALGHSSPRTISTEK